MKFIVYLLTLFMVGTAVAQNPTILQGNYITNVFGQSNFVLNPNARTDVLNVTNATRSTTTPLVATSEFTLSLTSGTNATWTLRAFDQGMKGQNCEARFSYRGFATATTKAELVQNSFVVASLTLTPSTDPRIASINFPCGDLTNLTTFRIAQTTANMTGTNEISGIYVGLATNQANVSQAELVGTWKMTGATNCVFSTTSPTYGSPSNYSTPDSDCNNPTVTGDIVSKGKVLGFDINMKPGKYVIQAQAPFVRSGSTVSGVAFRVTDGTTTSNNQLIYAASGFELFGLNTITFSTEYTTASTKTIYLDGISDTVSVSATIQNNGGREVQFLVYRFPTSSELVVTPERQNTWGGVQYRNATNTLLFNAVAAPTAYSAFNAAGWNQPTMLKGKAAVTTTGSGNDLGLSIPNMPVGSYQLNVSGFLMANTGNSGIGSTRVRCSFRVRETTTSSVIAQSTAQNWVINTASGLSDSRDYPHAFHGVYNNTAVATRNFILEASKITDNVGGNLGQCEVVTTGFDMDLTITIEPLDQPSNSALYVQGPVLGAQTGAAIPAGYQGEVASVTDTSIRTQVSPTTSGTWYTPWAGTLTLTTGNWNVCYRVVAEINQSLATNYSRIETRLYNVTDSAEQFTLVTLPSTGSNLNDLGNTHFGCKAISITSIKTYRVDIRHVGSATSVTLYFRNDISSGEIYATRLN